ncbi:MAG: riboflavin biosynthesis protein RibF [Clostridia bacterium]|nr:riboflavin biosynthesis protein RibF [Clostridia bacterium]
MPNAIALGTFDGIHPGHRAVLDAALSFYTVAVTFSAPPKALLGNEASLLMTPEDKERALKAYGVDEIEWLDFATVRNLSPAEFLDWLCSKYQPSRIVCGYDYRFGKNAAGTTETLREYCRLHDIDFVCADRVDAEGEPISSTRIRRWLADGNIEAANRYILGGFRFCGPVLHGDARGRLLGFPTANQLYPKALTPLKFGVYVARVEVDRKTYVGITNVGHRPTWPTDDVLCETNLLDFSGDLYGKEIAVYPFRFLRPERRFDSVEELTATVHQNIADAIAEKKAMEL